MKMLFRSLAFLIVLSGGLIAREAASPPTAPLQTEMGKWWKNSEIVTKLKLSEAQVVRIEQCFLNHRKELADANAELKQREAKLKTLMQADPLDEAAIRAQTERVSAGRSALEKANASIMLSIRKELTKDQWGKLEEIREVRDSLIREIVRSSPAVAAPHAPGTIIGLTPSGDKIYSVGGDVKAPQVLSRPMPSYTQAAKEAAIEGTLLLQATIRKDGSVDSFKILRGLGYGLDESAIDTIYKRWRFKPGTLNGQPVDVQVRMEVSFRLY